MKITDKYQFFFPVDIFTIVKYNTNNASLSLQPEGSTMYAGTFYTGVFLNGNGFYKNMDGSSNFELSEFRHGRLGYALADSATPKAFFQAGKSLALDNPKSFLGIDLPEEADLVELATLRVKLKNAAEVQLPNNNIADSL